MERVIDAHVHIIPPQMLNKTDPRFKIMREKFGIVRTSSGYPLRLLPSYFETSSFSQEALIQTMDQCNVEKAVIMQALCFKMNEEVANAVKSFPDRLAGAMVVEPADGWEEEMRHWKQCGLNVLKFEMSAGMGFSSRKAYPEMRFDDPILMKMFDLAQRLQITVTIDPSSIGGHGYQPEALYEAARTHKELHFVICHLGYPKEDMQQGSVDEQSWEKMLSLAELPNVWVDVSALPALFGNEEYPYCNAVGKVAAFKNQYGCEKIIWGSDIPGTLMNATYAQMFNMFERSSAFTKQEKQKLFWQNAQDAYNL